MATMERACRRAGYATLAIDYPGRRLSIAALAAFVDDRTTRWTAARSGQVHFLTHSMGGLVATALIKRHRPARLGRVVMLGPPNQGSEIADLLAPFALYKAVFGPAGADLTTRHATGLESGPVHYPVGIIAGRRALDPLSWLILPKPNDGKVTVARTRLVGMSDHLVLPVTHAL